MPSPLPAPFALRRVRASLIPVLFGSFALACGASVPVMNDDALFVLSDPVDDNCGSVAERFEHLDDPTPLGFSAVDVLTRLAGPRSVPLFWLAPAENQEYELTYGPEQGRSTLALDVRAAEG